MNALQKTAQSILDKVDKLLTSEPARMIGYGAAVVVYLTVRVIGELKPGLFPVVGFDEAVGVAFTALASTVILVESIRRFVYSPLTYIEDLSDESQAAHEAAHLEEDLNRLAERVMAERDAQAKQPTTIAVGSAKPRGSAKLDS